MNFTSRPMCMNLRSQTLQVEDLYEIYKSLYKLKATSNCIGLDYLDFWNGSHAVPMQRPFFHQSFIPLKFILPFPAMLSLLV